MKKFNSFLIVILGLSSNLLGQDPVTKFNIPTSTENQFISLSDNCSSCNAALNPELLKKQTLYHQSNLRDWLYQYFKSTEEQRKEMKSSSSNDINLAAVVNTIPIKFGYGSDESSQHIYWSKKYTEWVNTRQISIDDIIYIFKQESDDQLKAWLDCRKISCSSTANYADEKIFMEITKIREGNYDISLTNYSIAPIKISEIQVPDFLFKKSGKDFKVGKKVSQKGGKVIGTFSSSQSLDENFSVKLTYKVLATNDENTVIATFKKILGLPEVPIGTIISTTMTYEQFLKANQFENLSSAEQKWLPCDGRIVINGNFITTTPDLRGIFIRGANVMDKNENLHTKPVSDKQRNPDEPQWGDTQGDALKTHKHYYSSPGNPGFFCVNFGCSSGMFHGNLLQKLTENVEEKEVNETRPKNLSTLYLIKVR